MITADGCWAEFRIAADRARGRPCLFLDRDGVLIEDVGYPHRRDDVIVIGAALDLVRMARQAGFVTGLVTNQSGIARGYFDWPAFAAVQAHVDTALRRHGAALDFVLACPHHGAATVPRYRCADHDWRKPRPGMLRAAASRLGIDLARSIMVGDRMSDMEAGAAAGLAHLWLLDGGADRPGAPHRTRAVGRDGLAAALSAVAPREQAPGRKDAAVEAIGQASFRSP